MKKEDKQQEELNTLKGKVGEKLIITGYYKTPVEAEVTKVTAINIHIKFPNEDGLIIPKQHYLKGVTDYGYKKDAVKLTPVESSKVEEKKEDKQVSSVSEIKQKALKILHENGQKRY